MARDDSSEADARARMGAQMPLEAKARLADIVVDNNGPLEALERQVRPGGLGDSRSPQRTQELFDLRQHVNKKQGAGALASGHLSGGFPISLLPVIGVYCGGAGVLCCCTAAHGLCTRSHVPRRAPQVDALAKRLRRRALLPGLLMSPYALLLGVAALRRWGPCLLAALRGRLL